MTGYYKTIADLEKATYGSMGGDSLLKAYADNPQQDSRSARLCPSR